MSGRSTNPIYEYQQASKKFSGMNGRLAADREGMKIHLVPVRTFEFLAAESETRVITQKLFQAWPLSARVYAASRSGAAVDGPGHRCRAAAL